MNNKIYENFCLLFIKNIEKKKLIANERSETFRLSIIDFANRKTLLADSIPSEEYPSPKDRKRRNKNGKTILRSIIIASILLMKLRVVVFIKYHLIK